MGGGKAGDADGGRAQQLTGFGSTQDPLFEGHAGPLHMRQFGGHLQGVVEARRLDELHLDRPHHENDAVAVPQVVLLETDGAQPLGARPLEEFQVIDVVDDTAGVGVLVVDADRPSKSGRPAVVWRPQNNSSCGPAILGGSSPKCR